MSPGLRLVQICSGCFSLEARSIIATPELPHEGPQEEDAFVVLSGISSPQVFKEHSAREGSSGPLAGDMQEISSGGPDRLHGLVQRERLVKA